MSTAATHERTLPHGTQFTGGMAPLSHITMQGERPMTAYRSLDSSCRMLRRARSLCDRIHRMNRMWTDGEMILSIL